MRVSLYLLVLLLGACATQHLSKTAAPAPPAPPGTALPAPAAEDLLQQLKLVSLLESHGEYSSADKVLARVIAADGFQALEGAHQHLALQLGAATALQLHDPQRGFSLIKRACEMPQTDGLDWYLRVRAANIVRDSTDAAMALTVLAQRGPQLLARLQDDAALDPAMNALGNYGSDADRYRVLSALFTAYFPTEPESSSGWWGDLALLQLMRGERATAIATLGRVTNPYVVISIEADKRFDPIRSQIENRLNVEEITRRAIDTAARRVQHNPDMLEPMLHLANLLDVSLRFEAVLRVAEVAIDRQEAQGRSVYTDYDKRYVGILDYRAEALFNLGRWDAAVEQLQTAAAMAQSGGPNVAQVIDLANLYADLGRPQESLATLQRLKPATASAFGDMQAELVKLYALVQLRDIKSANESLRFLSDHRGDSLGVYQEALLVADRKDEAARLLISRLADPRLRADALVVVQQYSEGTLPPWMLQEDQLWRALLERQDVKQAIARVGTVRRYPLTQPGY